MTGGRSSSAAGDASLLFDHLEGFRAYLDRLEFATVSVTLAHTHRDGTREGADHDVWRAETRAAGRENHWDITHRQDANAGGVSSAKAHRGNVAFIVHSLLGPGLRSVACRRVDICKNACESPGDCPWSLLLAPAGDGRGAPLGRVARVPPPYRVEADWRIWRAGEPLSARIVLFGTAAQYALLVRQALATAASKGVGRARLPMVIEHARLSHVCLGAICRRASDKAGLPNGRRLRLELRSPVRLMRSGHPLRVFSLPDVVRNLNLRLAVWGHYHQGLPWASRWSFLEEDAHTARVTTEVRWTTSQRYSRRQNRVLRAGGLMGTVVLDNVSPGLAHLLRAGEVLGIGKGGTSGFGCIQVHEM